jgi:hypothetical protein
MGSMCGTREITQGKFFFFGVCVKNNSRLSMCLSLLLLTETFLKNCALDE